MPSAHVQMANICCTWSDGFRIGVTWCKIAQDCVQVHWNELHPVIFYIPELLITRRQLSGNKCNLYGNACCLVTTLSVGNSKVYLLCLCHVHIISEDVKERDDVSLLRLGGIRVLKPLKGLHLKYFASRLHLYGLHLNCASALKPTQQTLLTFLKIGCRKWLWT